MEIIPMHQIKKEYSPGYGRHWFDRDTMRFFQTRLASVGYRGPGGTFFVSSERPPNGRRLYSVRRLVGPGKIETVGKSCSINSRSTADRLARKYAEYGHRVCACCSNLCTDRYTAEDGTVLCCECAA